MAGKPVTNPAGLIFQALACDLRLRILNAVNSGVTDNAQLAVRLGIGRKYAPKAIASLLRAGLLTRRGHGLAVTPLARDLIGRVLAERPVLEALRGQSRERAA